MNQRHSLLSIFHFRHEKMIGYADRQIPKMCKVGPPCTDYSHIRQLRVYRSAWAPTPWPCFHPCIPNDMGTSKIHVCRRTATKTGLRIHVLRSDYNRRPKIPPPDHQSMHHYICSKYNSGAGLFGGGGITHTCTKCTSTKSQHNTKKKLTVRRV